VLDEPFLRVFAVVHGCLDLGPHDGHSGHDALDGNELVDEV
jgi:hypothetical protein